MTMNSDIIIDVVIPVINKDLGTLPYVIDSVRKYVRHPINRIFVVAPTSRKIESVCHRQAVQTLPFTVFSQKKGLLSQEG